MILHKATLSILLLSTLSLSLADWEHNYDAPSLIAKRTLLRSSSRSRSTLPWKFLIRSRSDEAVQSNESGSSSSNEGILPPLNNSDEENEVVAPVAVQQQQVPDSDEDVSGSVEEAPPVIRLTGQKGESGRVVKSPSSDSNESDEEERDEVAPLASRDLITFSYYPINQRLDNSGSLVYEIEDQFLRTARGGWGKGKKKKCKKGKKGKKKKGKGKKKGKKGCSIKGGWWYVWDKKHGYLAGRWGDPPPKGLEREHYHHNFGKLGHSYGQGYDGHGHMGWKVNKGWGGGHGGGHHGGHGGGYGGGAGGGFGGGYGGGAGGFGGYGGGGFGGGGGHHGHGGWGKPVEYYGWGWAEKQKGWGWRR